ncbi:MAG: hypothetical protein EBZ84_11030 [Betaproteobacteria bacterium]|nr:hypothetical protein [Betaproteobacteria bacterium]
MNRYDIYCTEDKPSARARTAEAAIAEEIGAWWDQESFEFKSYVAIPKDGRHGLLAQFDLPKGADHIATLCVPTEKVDLWTACLKPIGTWISSCNKWSTSEGGVDEVLERIRARHQSGCALAEPSLQQLGESIDRYRLQNIIYDYRSVLEECFSIEYDDLE